MNYPSIRIEGSILSPDILEKLDDANGQRPADFGLEATVKVKDEIARAWADAQDYWRIFKRKTEKVEGRSMKDEKDSLNSSFNPHTSSLTTETRNLWVVPLLGLLGYQLEYEAKSIELNSKLYPISHRVTNRGNAAIHIIGCNEPAGLDRKPGAAKDEGRRMKDEKQPLTSTFNLHNSSLSSKMSAHAMMQEYLNLTEQLYGIVTNGRLLRLLRDSSRLVKLTYLEFDLDRIFTDGLFADFAILYRLLHVTRLPAQLDNSADSIIERYHQDSLDSGARIRDGLSKAVENAIRTFANGFLMHPDNEELRRAVSSEQRAGESQILLTDFDRLPLTAHRSLTPQEFYSHLLRLIYRLLFLMVIEERNLIYPPSQSAAKRDIYDRYYSLMRLRRLSEKRYLADRRHDDHWLALLATFNLFEDGGPGSKLGIAPLAGDLFRFDSIGPLGRCALDNETLLQCLRALSLYENPNNGQVIRVNYAALNVEEFGSVYEGLLEYEPVFLSVSGERRAENQRMASSEQRAEKAFDCSPLTAHRSLYFDFKKGDERAATGSHYTPDDLVQPLIKHSLDYLIQEKLASGERRAEKIENLTEEEKRDVYQILSGSRSLATGNDTGGDGIHSNKIVSQGRTIRHDITDSSSGIFNTSKYSGGVGTGVNQGISALSENSSGKSTGAGNASSVISAGKSGFTRGDHPTHGNLSDTGPSADSPATPPYSEARFLKLWSETPLTARRSLLASQALLSLRVADISCGSGHILLAAARRIATELAVVRTGEEQPSPIAFRTAVRDVICNCIYGVDLNPLAVELCKVALWLEAHIPGQPLNFLDHHIKCGNAIVGFARRDELERGVPDEAFTTMPGDDKEIAASFRKRNKEERQIHEKRLGKQDSFAFTPEVEKHLSEILKGWRTIAALPERNPTEIEAKKKRYQEFANGQDAWLLNQVAAIPVAQFYIEKVKENQPKLITDEEYRRYLDGHRTPQGQATAMAWATANRKRFFHWFLEFPEIIEQGGFDCILGNPPYLGNRALSGTYGNSFLEWVKFEFAPAGSVDLVTYFFRRIFELLRPSGILALISTNTIAQGSARESGLEVIQSQGGRINFAVRSQKWPGRASVEVSLIALVKGSWNRPFILNGKPVSRITSYLDSEETTNNPIPLTENIDRSFIGSYVLGMGFILDPAEAHSLIQTTPKLSEVIFPYINGFDLNNTPEQVGSRWIINFYDWSEEKCKKEYPEAYSIVEQKVKPVRTRKNDNGDFVLRKPLPERWWIYADKRPKLYSLIKNMSRILVVAQVSRTVAFAFVSPKQVLDSMLVVFAFEQARYFAVMQSSFHYHWAWRYCTTMKADLRYVPSSIFVQFPFPNFNSNDEILDNIGDYYHEYRCQQMLLLNIGLTKLYNLFHNCELTPAIVAKISGKPDEAEVGYQGILELRKLHRELDEAVLAAYGWTDLNLGHDFHEVETLPENDRVRYTISPDARKELLKRLLALNHQRAAEEKAKLPAKAEKAGKGKGSKGKKSVSEEPGLFG